MKLHLFAACFVAAAIAMPAQAQTPAGSGKVGYVDIDRVTSKAKPINDVMEDIQGQIKELQDNIETRRRKVRELEADLKRNDGVLSTQIQNQKKSEIDKLKNELDDLDYRARREMQKMDETKFAPLLKQILFTIQEVAQEEKYDLVLRGEAVLYGTSAVDLTDLVIKKLDQGGGSKAAASKPTSTPAPEAEEAEETTKTEPVKPEPTPKATSTPRASTPKPAATPRATATPRSTPRATQATPASGTRTRPVDRQPD
jgi:outer membrane protein